MSPTDVSREVDHNGFAIVPDVLKISEIHLLIDAIEPLLADIGRVKGGIRNVFNRCLTIRHWCQSSNIWDWVEPILGSNAVIVNSTLFDKADGRNWKVPFHQDVTIRVNERRAVEGFETWWEKEGIPHVWPTAAVLERMVALRIHLDDCGPENGPLRVIPQSHQSGILSSEQIDFWRTRHKERTCTTSACSLILMRPLLLHASSTATFPQRRRVIHLEFAEPELPGELEWYERVSRVK